MHRSGLLRAESAAGGPLLVVANEVSGTATLFRIERERLVGASSR